jgi:hypothetical protein
LIAPASRTGGDGLPAAGRAADGAGNGCKAPVFL